MLSTITPPREWARKGAPLDVFERRDRIRERVLRNGERMVYKISPAKGFSGCDGKDAACLYISGCSFHCVYCFVNPASLAGRKGEFMSPEKAFRKLRRIILKTENPHVQFNGGEVFLTPDWTLEVIRLLCDFFENDCPFTSKQKPGRIWCDTMGFDLIREPHLFQRLQPFRKHVALFISTKGHPDDYEIIARAPREVADEPFRAIHEAWKHRLVAIPEVLDRFFYPQTMDWYMRRLRKIHPNAPRVLHLDIYSPINRVRWSPDIMIKKAGFRPNKSDPERNVPLRDEVVAAWQDKLQKVYGISSRQPRYRGKKRPTFCCDDYPDESFRMVERLIISTAQCQRLS